MQALRKFARSSAVERRLILQSFLVVPAVRLGLWLLPFRVVHRLVRDRRVSGRTAVSAERIVWAVTAAAARVPRATCLTQALAASVLLPRYGHDATLRVGVAKDEDGRLRAHAWLESGGVTILGEPEPGAFQVLPPVALS
jgi:Transglutaminase-like superfamily